MLNMQRDRLNDTQKEILRIFRETSKQKREEDFDFAKKDLSKQFFNRPQIKRSGGRSLSFNRGNEFDKSLAEKRLLHKVESEKQAWTRRTKDLRDTKLDIRDWRERIGLKSGLRGIFSKKQELFNRNIKDLVRKGYLKGTGSGLGQRYRPTEKTFNAKISRF